jgi:hypothetical protein
LGLFSLFISARVNSLEASLNSSQSEEKILKDPTVSIPSTPPKKALKIIENAKL